MSEMLSAMRDAGIEPPNRIETDGSIHRFANKGKRTKDCWYWAKEIDGAVVGAAGDWASGVKVTFGSKSGVRAVLDEIRKEREDTSIEAKSSAQALWNIAVSYGISPYLQAKGVSGHGIRHIQNRIYVPMRDIEGTLWGLQTIFPDGKKLFTPGCAKQGKFHTIGDLAHPGLPVLVAEGYATAATMHELTCCPTVVAFDCGNLGPVIDELRKAVPTKRLILLADNDHASVCPRHKKEGGYHSPFKPRPKWCRCNPGLTTAMEIAERTGARWIAPPNPPFCPGTDWNDFMAHRGAEMVYRAFTKGAQL